MAKILKPNNNLKPCKSCHEMISKTAKTCPHCGDDAESNIKIVMGIIGIIIFIIIWIIIKSMTSQFEQDIQNNIKAYENQAKTMQKKAKEDYKKMF